jgi:TRAP-type C4-dicarboxylate transport system substrate-binding protein
VGERDFHLAAFYIMRRRSLPPSTDSRGTIAAMRPLAMLLLVGALSVRAGAEPMTLRFATSVPDGSAWARELRAWGRDVASETEGAVNIKMYFSGIAGDEMHTLERIQREQLDGAGGSEMCIKLAPSMRISRVVGLFHSRDEAVYVMQRLRPQLDREFQRSGYVNLGEAGIGQEVLMARTPVRSLSELRAQRIWVWDIDHSLLLQAAALGLHPVPMPIEEAARGFEEGKFDVFVTPLTAALAFQWSAEAHYLINLHIGFRIACLFVSNRAFDALPVAAQQSLRAAANKLQIRFEDLGRQQDEALLGGLLQRQGVVSVPISSSFRSEFFDAARRAREATEGQLLPGDLIQRVLAWLADYRIEHPHSGETVKR